MMLKLNPIAFFISLCSLTIALGTKPAIAIVISDFTGAFAPSAFTFSANPSNAGTVAGNLETFDNNSPVDGIIDTVILYGPDSLENSLGTNTSGSSYFVEWAIGSISTTQAGNISFDWSFDSFTTDEDDSAGYFINTIFTSLAIGNLKFESSSQPVELNLAVGDRFGFWASTKTNQGREGALTIRNFNAQPIPFESDVLPLLGATALFAGGVWWKRRPSGEQLDSIAPESEQKHE